MDINSFFKSIKIKKKISIKTKNKIESLNKSKNKNLNVKLVPSVFFKQKLHIVKYILNITFLNTNTLLQVIDSSGQLIFCCSAGSVNFKGKKKNFRKIVMKEIFKKLVLNILHLRKQPIALHFKNVSSNLFWLLKMFKNFFFYKCYPNLQCLPF